uniref:chitin synthase n=1 Tax=Mycena chlorophos TaxID=658473 RepID=A0ABQ0LP80_MYCCL|nr:glycosyltransferase family 2 protein [Mycena chlorophos]
MEQQYRGERPPRQARPRQSASLSPAPNYPEQQQAQYPQYQQYHRASLVSPPPSGGVTFRNVESGDRSAPLARPTAGVVGNNSFLGNDPESGMLRKKSLVRPDREKIEPGHRQWHYRTHVAQLEEEAPGRVGVLPSTTGNYPQRQALRRGRSLLAREEDVHESGLALFKRGATLRRKRSSAAAPLNPPTPAPKDRSCLGDYAPGPKGPWMLYCYLITACVPIPLMRTCGLRSPEQQRAWREKMGLLSIILSLMATVGFITFGFTQAVCGTPANRYHGGAIGTQFIGNSSVVINGYDYDFSNFKHPAGGTFDGKANPVFEGNWGLAGNDASFLFQITNENCLGLVTRPNTSQITGKGEFMDWYFPCNIYSQYGQATPNTTAYGSNTNCHLTSKGQLSTVPKLGQVYFTWDDVTKTTNRSLAVFESTVIDLQLLNWLNSSEITVPSLFNEMKSSSSSWARQDITMQLRRMNQMQEGRCLQDMITVGFIDTNSIGCVASQVLLYLSLIFIVGVVLIRFVMAVMFQWFFSHKLGNFPRETYEERMKRAEEIEQWSADIYKPAPAGMRPNVSAQAAKAEKRKTFLPITSRFTPSDGAVLGGGKGRPSTAYGHLGSDSGSVTNAKRGTKYAGSVTGKGTSTPPDRRSKSLMAWGAPESPAAHPRGAFADNPCPFPLGNVVPQPPPDYEPFNFPLAHTICLVTAYSESVEGLRTTLDSLATTDYPNSHKIIVIIADGMVKGAGNDMTTPDICLTMMKEFIIAPEDVEAHSYVAIADGHRRHNMAKVYAGYYSYDDATIERSKQQRVPVVLVAKVGNPLEADDAKPGNRGKRDSQIVLMAFLQKVMFDERMTTFEYEFFNSIWRVAGVSPERYELVLCVDADTKVFPDAMSRMVSCMVCDTEIMGLCGETKVANKAETFVTMMQVFEYYISHHMTKSFESMFGGVTCLPGCFTMYRIKAPKGESGFWVPILANPDIVEHYSENVVDTLHKKNLLLLGEDRYLTTLMLKTFPKRKNVFCPQAVCKTTVPDTFRVLLSQRRRWINSTIHNLAELILVRDLCGTFCFSMQFVVGMELAGTLVLPAAISFTIYLIVASIIPHHANTTVPLVLLAFVLGIPLILIVITSRKIAYVGWMLIYLLSLPIWNGVLPAYAFWHFDDFSWGQTRKVSGNAKDHTGDKEGEFDSSHIVMKRWAEFERERRWRSGSTSREDEDGYRWKADSNRYSMASNSDNYHPPSGVDSSTLESTNNNNYPAPRRHDANAVLMLPTPLAVSRNTTHSGSSGPTSSSSAQRLVTSPSTAPVDMWVDSFDSAPAQSRSPPPRPPRENYRRSMDASTPPTSANPFMRGGSPAVPTYDEPETFVRSPVSAYNTQAPLPQLPPQATRGVQLTDSGPVPSADGGVRRVARNSRRATSQAPVGAGGQGQQQQQQQQNRYSRNSTVGPGAPGGAGGWSLPPGAAPPKPYGGAGGGNGGYDA